MRKERKGLTGFRLIIILFILFIVIYGIFKISKNNKKVKRGMKEENRVVYREEGDNVDNPIDINMINSTGTIMNEINIIEPSRENVDGNVVILNSDEDKIEMIN